MPLKAPLSLSISRDRAFRFPKFPRPCAAWTELRFQWELSSLSLSSIPICRLQNLRTSPSRDTEWTFFFSRFASFYFIAARGPRYYAELRNIYVHSFHRDEYRIQICCTDSELNVDQLIFFTSSYFSEICISVSAHLKFT